MRVCPSALLFTSLTPCSVCNLATTQPAVATCRERAIVCRHSPHPANAPLFTSFHFYWTSEQLIQACLLCAQFFLFSCSLMDQYEWADGSQIIRLKTLSLITGNNILTNLVIFLACLWDLLMDMNFELMAWEEFILFYFTIYIMLAKFSLRLHIDGTIIKWPVLPAVLFLDRQS